MPESKYKKEYDEKVYKLCLLGATDKEIADYFDVAESTFYYWKTNETSFSESIKAGKIEADMNVSKRLYKRAIGYKYTEKEYRSGELIREVEKEVAPDVGAAMAWLKNRRRNKELNWNVSNKQEIQSTNTNLDIDLNLLTDEQKKKIMGCNSYDEMLKVVRGE